MESRRTTTPHASSPQAEPRVLLVIDDSKADRNVYRRYLSQDPQLSYTMLEADTARKGLELYQQRQFDAVLLDYQLPDMSGLQALGIITQQQPHAAVIMLTA